MPSTGRVQMYAPNPFEGNSSVSHYSKAAPSDNGSVDSIGATILPVTFAGTLNADPGTGEISIGAAAPNDSYIVTVTITDNCDATTEQNFALDVVVEKVFSDGFETP
jgi:hypothetical protein